MKVLIAYDGSIYSEIAVSDLERAGLPPDTHAMVISVVDPRDWMKRLPAAEQSAEEACNRLQGIFPGWTVQLESPAGHPASIILDRAKTYHADLIVVGTHGRTGVGRFVLGSVSTAITRDATCSVRVARADSGLRGGPLRILIGNDGSAESEIAVREVCGRSWPAGSEARVVAVVEEFAGAHVERVMHAPGYYSEVSVQEHHWLDNVVDESVQQLSRAGLKVSSVVEDGDAKETLIYEGRTWKADCIFVGGCGLGQLERFLLGSVSATIVTKASCTVEVVRRHP